MQKGFHSLCRLLRRSTRVGSHQCQDQSQDCFTNPCYLGRKWRCSHWNPSADQRCRPSGHRSAFAHCNILKCRPCRCTRWSFFERRPAFQQPIFFLKGFWNSNEMMSVRTRKTRTIPLLGQELGHRVAHLLTLDHLEKCQSTWHACASTTRRSSLRTAHGDLASLTER